MKNKIILGLGTLATITIPVAATISCGNLPRKVTLEKAKKADGFILEFNPSGFENYVELTPKKPIDYKNKNIYISKDDSKKNKILEFVESLKENQTALNNWKPGIVYVKILKDLDSSATSANLAQYFSTPYRKEVQENAEDGFGNKVYTDKPINNAQIVSSDIKSTGENDFIDSKGLILKFGSSLTESQNAESISNILISGGVRIKNHKDKKESISNETLLGIKSYLEGSEYIINPKKVPTLEKGKIKTLDLIKKDSFDSVNMIKESLSKISVSSASSIPKTTIASQTSLNQKILDSLGGTINGFFPTDIKGTTIEYKIPKVDPNSVNLVVTITKGKFTDTTSIKITK